MNQPMSESAFMEAQLSQGQQQLDNDPNAIHADILRDEQTATFLKQLNPDNLLVDIEHRIRGEKKNDRGEWIPITANSTPVSEKLISNFMSFLGSILNQNASMSNFSSAEINNLMEMIITYVGIDLTINDQEYGIVENYTEMWRISMIINSSCFFVLKQAMNGMFARRVFGTMKLHGDLTQDNKPKMADALRIWK